MVMGADLKVVSTEIEIFSSIRSAIAQEDEVVGLIDCGASTTKLYIIDKGIVSQTFSVTLAGADLTQHLAKELSIEFAAAEEKKRVYGIGGTLEGEVVRNVLLKDIDRGLREISTMIARYEEEHHTTVQKIILSGSGSLLPGLTAYAEGSLSRAVVLADPFSKVSYPAFLEDTLREAGPTFTVAIGTALRGLTQ